MLQGLYIAVSGIQANQNRLNVISNNIANVNTVAFKGSNVNFADTYAQTVYAGTVPEGNLGGTNPKQYGTGVMTADIAVNFGQGGVQYTGRSSDLMIEGNGYFAVQKDITTATGNGMNYVMTRAGNFSLDGEGNLVTAGGNKLRGTSQLSGNEEDSLSTVNIPQEMMIVKDVDSTGAVLGTHFAPVGTAIGTITGAMTAGASGQTIESVKLQSFSINGQGAVIATYSNGDRITVRTDAATVDETDLSAARREIVHYPAEGGSFPGINQTTSDAGMVDQIGGAVFMDAAGAGSLRGMQLQLQAVMVPNEGGLLSNGGNTWILGANTGEPQFGIPGHENRGGILSGALESSNVDLSAEFANMIVSQRALEANSRVVRTENEVLQTLINLV